MAVSSTSPTRWMNWPTTASRGSEMKLRFWRWKHDAAQAAAEYERNRCTAMSPMRTGRCERPRDHVYRNDISMKSSPHHTGQGRIGLLVQW